MGRCGNGGGRGHPGGPDSPGKQRHPAGQRHVLRRPARRRVPYINADGEDARLYYLLAGYDSNGKAAEWLSMASEQYVVEDTVSEA